MTSLSNAVWNQIGMPIGKIVTEAVVDVLQGSGPNSTPRRSGGTVGSIRIESHGKEFTVVANDNFTKLDRGDDSITGDEKFTHVYTQRSSKGLVYEVTRTYIGSKPKKIPGASQGGWRVVPITPRTPMNLIQRALGEALTDLENKVRGILPSSIEITSLA